MVFKAISGVLACVWKRDPKCTECGMRVPGGMFWRNEDKGKGGAERTVRMCCQCWTREGIESGRLVDLGDKHCALAEDFERWLAKPSLTRSIDDLADGDSYCVVHGKRLSKDAAACLLDHLGNTPAPGAVSAELSKLATFVGDRHDITVADVCAMVTDARRGLETACATRAFAVRRRAEGFGRAPRKGHFGLAIHTQCPPAPAALVTKTVSAGFFADILCAPDGEKEFTFGVPTFPSLKMYWPADSADGRRFVRMKTDSGEVILARRHAERLGRWLKRLIAEGEVVDNTVFLEVCESPSMSDGRTSFMTGLDSGVCDFDGEQLGDTNDPCCACADCEPGDCTCPACICEPGDTNPACRVCCA